MLWYLGVLFGYSLIAGLPSRRHRKLSPVFM
jgi:hypothetical protein